MTKAAIAQLTKYLAVEWGKYNIIVNAVAPTFICTPGTDSCLANPEFRSDVIEPIAACTVLANRWTWRAWSYFLPSAQCPLSRGKQFHSWRVDRQVARLQAHGGKLITSE